jgi:uncharacterized protein
MSTLKATLKADLQSAMLAKDDVRRATLRMVLAATTTEEVSGDEARELTDAEVQAVLKREAKKRKEAATAFADGGRPERAERERAELADAELVELVRAAVAEVGATGQSAMGQVMKAAQAAVAGRADGGRVAAEVRRQLG